MGHFEDANYRNQMARAAHEQADYGMCSPPPFIPPYSTSNAAMQDREEAHDAASRDYMELAAGITAAYGALRYYNASQADDTYEDEQPRRPRRDGFIKGLVKDFIKAL